MSQFSLMIQLAFVLIPTSLEADAKGFCPVTLSTGKACADDKDCSTSEKATKCCSVKKCCFAGDKCPAIAHGAFGCPTSFCPVGAKKCTINKDGVQTKGTCCTTKSGSCQVPVDIPVVQNITNGKLCIKSEPGFTATVTIEGSHYLVTDCNKPNCDKYFQ